jgi:beta-galactosidase/beta-glucuronidase
MHCPEANRLRKIFKYLPNIDYFRNEILHQKNVIMNMRTFYRLTFLAIIAIFCEAMAAQPAGRNIQNFNFDWKFFKGDVADGQSPVLDDKDWRILDLPHDWSIEGPFSSDNSSCTGYLPGGIGWYRKTFTMPDYESGRKVFIYFDGVYNNSEVWINGKYLGKRPNGYISFQYDLTPYLNFGKENLIAVKVDHTLDADSR